MNQNFYSSID